MPPPDDAKYDIREEQGIIRCVFRGRLHLPTTDKAIADSAAAATAAGCKSVLFDFANADFSDYVFASLEHARVARSLGLDSTFRIAFVNPTERHIVEYIETVARNRGYNAKAFTGYPEAIAWLKS